MYTQGLVLALIGLLMQMPQGLASLGLLPGESSGALPGDPVTRGMVLAGVGLCFCGLHRAARAKGRSGGVALLGLLAAPGALAGLAAVLYLRTRRSAPGSRPESG